MALTEACKCAALQAVDFGRRGKQERDNVVRTAAIRDILGVAPETDAFTNGFESGEQFMSAL